ncbi:MAG: phage tail tube protein [Candidatus Promineifilaceae bacterium]|jgi:predicted secreted protein
MAKNQGFLVTLQWDPSGGTTLTTIGQIMDINGPEVSRDEIEVTTRDSTEYWMEFIKGMKNGGNISFGVVLDLSLATHGTAATGILSDLQSETTMPAWKINFPNSRQCTFDGFITAFPPAAPMKDALTADITVKVTGKPVFATAA